MAIDVKKLQEALEIYAEALLIQVKENLRKSGKGGGKLDKSLHFKIVKYEVQILSLDYGYWVNKGRKPSKKLPPPQAIQYWVKEIGLPDSAAYPIAKKIAKDGIKPTFFIDNALKTTAVPLRRQLKRDIKTLIQQSIKKSTK